MGQAGNGASSIRERVQGQQEYDYQTTYSTKKVRLKILKVGTDEVLANFSGSNTSGLGTQTLTTLKTGNNNVAIGFQSGSSTITGVASSLINGSYNTFIGSQSTPTNDCSNSSCLGYGCEITGSNQIVIGTTNETTYIKGKLILNFLRCTATTTLSNNVPSTILLDNGTSNIIITLPVGTQGVITSFTKIKNSTGSVTLQFSGGLFTLNGATSQTSTILGVSSKFKPIIES